MAASRDRQVTPKAGSAPGAPGSIASAYAPGPNTGGVYPSLESAADVTGGGAGGDIDNPDVTGRGSLGNVARQSTPEPDEVCRTATPTAPAAAATIRHYSE